MKKNSIYIALLILVFNCTKNDKEVYFPNDNFELTVLVYPKRNDKTIRFFKDFSNLNITFSLKKEPNGFHQELKKRFIEGPSIYGYDKDLVDEYSITDNDPFEKKLKGIYLNKMEY